MKRSIQILLFQVLLVFILLAGISKIKAVPAYGPKCNSESFKPDNDISSRGLNRVSRFVHSSRSVNAKALIRTKALREKCFLVVTILSGSYELAESTFIRHSAFYETFLSVAARLNIPERSPPAGFSA